MWITNPRGGHSWAGSPLGGPGVAHPGQESHGILHTAIAIWPAGPPLGFRAPALVFILSLFMAIS